MAKSMSRRTFEAIQRIKGYRPYRSGTLMTIGKKPKHWRIWKFHELPSEYHELVK